MINTLELQPGSRILFIDTNREFNLLIVTTADSKYATSTMAKIQAQTRRF